MIIPDLNLVLYEHVDADARHEAAREWWEQLLNGNEAVGIPLAVSVGFVRLATSPTIVSPPWTSSEAVAKVLGWFEHPRVTHIDSGVSHFANMAECLAAAGRSGKLVTDAHIAVLALDHDAVVHSADRDFRLFPNVRWHKPLELTRNRG